uniref:C-type lectin domain-containing protein n=1 Tax=Seriola dumerili TaxID=41447 RepID=A0A3B4UCE2_SERDU
PSNSVCDSATKGLSCLMNLSCLYCAESCLTWTEAQHYCREKHTDLVTIESFHDISRLNRQISGTEWSWIGLNDDPKSWKGVMATGETSETDYHNWYPNEPNNKRGHQKCVFAYRDGRWLDEICQRKLSFVCFNGKKILCLMI